MLTRPGTTGVLMAATVGMVPRTAVPLGVGSRRFLTEQSRFVICLFAIFYGQGCRGSVRLSVRSNFFIVMGEVKWRGYEGLCEVKSEAKFQTQLFFKFA